MSCTTHHNACECREQKFAALEQALKVAREALEAIHQNTGELQPNSGHMYLSDINACYLLSGKALAEIREEGE